jgi:uncharacterized repeat protein (TIGR03806 family)
MRTRPAVLALALAGALGMLAPAAPAVGPVSVPVDGPPARMISEYNLFKDPQRQIPNDGVLPYDLNTPLFTDYAAKHRFVWMPEGSPAAYHGEEAFDFPVGTVLVKTFGYLHDMRDPSKGERLLETRLLIRQPAGWRALPYIWNEEGTDARLAVAGGRFEVSWIHNDGSTRDIRYLVPNMNQCKECHANQDVIQPIGPKARHLNKDYAYADGTANQLSRWHEHGFLDALPSAPETLPRAVNAADTGSGTLEQRARAWLDVNCAHCHNPKGPAFTSGLDLSLTQTDPHRLGFLKPPVAAGRGSGGHRFGIEPGKPDHSILVHRIESTELGVMMAPVGRTIVDDEGVALIREWITSMPPVDPALAAAMEQGASPEVTPAG